MTKTPKVRGRRREILKARDVLRRMRFAPVTWWRGGIAVDEMYRASPIFHVSHVESGRSIRTTADGIGEAIARLRRWAAERGSGRRAAA